MNTKNLVSCLIVKVLLKSKLKKVYSVVCRIFEPFGEFIGYQLTYQRFLLFIKQYLYILSFVTVGDKLICLSMTCKQCPVHVPYTTVCINNSSVLTV